MLELPVVGKIALPFMLAGVAGSAAPKINNTRLVEAAIIAVVSSVMMAGFAYFVAFPVLQEQVRQIKSEVTETKDTLRDALREIRTYQEGRRQHRDREAAAMEEKIQRIQVELAKRK